MASITCFLDESATDGSTPAAIVGGLLVDESGHEDLVSGWRELLDEFGLWPALHMNEFAPDKRLGKRSTQEKLSICAAAVEIINAEKIYSVSCCIQNAEYKAVVSKTTAKYHSQYQLCFVLAALTNGRMADYNGYRGEISFVMDRGNPYAEHVRRAFKEMKKIPAEPGLTVNLAELEFGNDHKELALQAADVICWGARRKAAGLPFRAEHQPIAVMLADESTHNHTLLAESGLRALDAYFSG